MKRNILFGMALMLIVSVMQFSCTRDPYEDVHSNEKSIESVTLTGGLTQVGPAVIDRVNAKATVKYLVEPSTDLSKVVASVVPSYRGSVSPAAGETVNFSSNSQSTFTITSEAGTTREWTVELVPFTETILGTFAIQDLVVYGGTGPEYGGGAVLKMTDKPWAWPETDGPAAELDNELKFEFSGASSDGKTYGTFTNSAGADGLYANFLFILDPQTDVNHFYRTLPKGEGTWSRDYNNNQVTFTFADGSTSTGTFADAGTEDLGNGLSKTITDNSLVFTLDGTDDWNKIYSDYDKFVKKPRKFWIDIKKK